MFSYFSDLYHLKFNPYINEFLACFIGNNFTTFCRNRQRLWFYSDCIDTHHLRLGSRRDCRIDYFEQSKKQVMNTIQLKDIGLKEYQEAWDLQNELFQEIIDIKIENRKREDQITTPNYFIFTEHPHVYTLGKSGEISNLLLNERQLQERGITFFKSNRGGDITYHGPGQIVGYPIINLDDFFPDIHLYMRNLEEVIILTIAEYGLKGERSEGETGVWLGVGTPFVRKICALGVRTSRWVTMHGFALNVTTNLGYFDHIIPCGIKGKSVTSLEAELGVRMDHEEIKAKILKHFATVFEAEFI